MDFENYTEPDSRVSVTGKCLYTWLVIPVWFLLTET